MTPNWYKSLLRKGLTNHDSDDLSRMVGTGRRISFASCCGQRVENTSISRCPKCGYYLKWSSRWSGQEESHEAKVHSIYRKAVAV